MRQLLPNLLHLQNYLGSPRQHTWSLAVEEHFYLALPLLLIALLRCRPRMTTSLALLPIIACAIAVICATARVFAFRKAHLYNSGSATHLRLDTLLFGVSLAYFYHFRPACLRFARSHRWKVLGLAIVLLLSFPAFVIAYRDSPYRWSLGFSILFLVYGAILLVLVQTPVHLGWAGWVLRGPLGRALAFVGYFSYPIYLWHLDLTRPMPILLRSPLMTALIPEMRWLVAFLAYAALAVAGGVLFGLLIDGPSLRLRERLFPARTRLPTEQ